MGVSVSDVHRAEDRTRTGFAVPPFVRTGDAKPSGQTGVLWNCLASHCSVCRELCTCALSEALPSDACGDATRDAPSVNPAAHPLKAHLNVDPVAVNLISSFSLEQEVTRRFRPSHLRSAA